MRSLSLQLLLVYLAVQSGQSFLSQQFSSTRDAPLFSISDWRDIMFDYPGTGNDRRIGTEQGAPPREVNILPFPYDQVLLQGETKQLRLYEDRFIKLFEDTQSNHCGVVAMGLLADTGMVSKTLLCEVEAYNRMDQFGIFVTIRVVGRAELIEVSQQEPYIKAVCLEMADKIPPNLELPNLLAKGIEESMALLSKLERKLEEAEIAKAEETGKDGDEMQRRINAAKLDDRFYEELSEEGDDDETDFDDNNGNRDRLSRFETAYRTALATDTQGYCITSTDEKILGKTAQELTAVSWAAFCTDLLPEMNPTHRIQALDSDNLFERLKLATHMLRQKETQLKADLVKAGVDVEGDEE